MLDGLQIKGRRYVTWFLLIFFSFIFLTHAWVCDDAVITFRVIDNFVNGCGLRWNTFERVQVYTHPLWLMIHIPFYLVTKEFFFTNIFISFLLCISTIYLLIRNFSKSLTQISVLVVCLGFSRAFATSSCNGLETPLSYFLLSLFVLFFLRESNYSEKKVLFLSFLAGLSILNRPDNVLFLIGPIFYIIFTSNNKLKKLGLVLTGFLPVLAWEIFALIYYGFPLPNTIYAKQISGYSRFEYLIRAIDTLKIMYYSDLITIFSLIMSNLLTITLSYRFRKTYLIFFGNFLYFAYFLFIGGEMYNDRFISIILLLSLINLLTMFELNNSSWTKRAYYFFIVISLLVCFFQPISRPSPLSVGIDEIKAHLKCVEMDKLSNDDQFYAFRLVRYRFSSDFPQHQWVYLGKWLRKKSEKKNITYVFGACGYCGYYAGPNVRIIDPYGLCDPLLSRLPALFNPNWPIGHCERYVPEGYLESIDTGINRIADPGIALFYEKVKIITQGPIWSKERFFEIFKTNLGLNNYLIDREKLVFARLKKLYWNRSTDRIFLRNISFTTFGLEVIFDKPFNFSEISMEIKKQKILKALLVQVLYDNVTLGSFCISKEQIVPSNKLETTKVSMKTPEYIRDKKINKIRIFPIFKSFWVFNYNDYVFYIESLEVISKIDNI